MGLYQDFTPKPRKRHDYQISEIEKKYSNIELSRLILYNLIHNYHPGIIFPERLCTECNKNVIPERFQLSQNTECLDCYLIEKKKNYDYILQIINEEPLEFEGDCILENKLYLGSIRSSFLKDDLKKLGITHILMVGYYMTPIYPDDFIYGNIEINDNANENILQYFTTAIKFIEESDICFTHCQVGKSRSAAFVMGYIMYKKKIHFDKAFDFVRQKRRIAFPNEGFQCQLEDFDIILSNFDYDLEKCDEFIKNFLENRKNLEESEKDYLEKRFEEKHKEKLGGYSDSESDSADNVVEFKDDNNIGEEEKNRVNIDKTDNIDINNNENVNNDDKIYENKEKLSEEIENKKIDEKVLNNENDNKETIIENENK